MKKHYISISLLTIAGLAFGESPVHNRVIDYVPAPGQFINTMPEWEEGDDATTMADKAYQTMVPDEGLITLGAWGGYVTVGFARTIVNVEGQRDFWIEGNAFQADQSSTKGGSSEPGVVLVAYDINGNGEPDDDEWFEIKGSEYENSVHNYELTYKRPESLESASDIPWSDNQENTGYVYSNQWHSQSYWPLWLSDKDELTFKGTRLPDNGVNEGTSDAPYFVLQRFDYGYADNYPNYYTSGDMEGQRQEGAKIDIDWAVDKDGNAVKMPGVDFVRIYTGVNQSNGWLGENSTEVGRVVNCHSVGTGNNEVVDETVVMDENVLADFLSKYGQGGVGSLDNENVRVYVDQNGTVRFALNSRALVSVFNQSGVLLYQTVCKEGANTIDISGYPSGLYLIKVDNVTTKILKK